MYVGILTGPFSDTPFEKVVKWAGENGITALEAAAGPGSKHIDTEKVVKGGAAKVKALLKKEGVRLSSLAQYQNLLDPDPEKRKAACDSMKLTIEAAAALGVDVVCTMAGMPVPGKDKMRTINEDFAAVWPPMGRYAKKRGVKIAFENWYATLLQGLDCWERVFSIASDDNVGLNFDPSHLYWMQVDYLEAVTQFGKRIFHTHAKDTEVRYDRLRKVGVLGGGWWRYCIPGYGKIHWAEYIARLKSVGYDGVLSIEHEDNLMGREEGFIKGRQHLEQFI
jgi:sugar phosphate isomerase/epimerase